MSGTNVQGLSGLARMILALIVVLVVAGVVLNGISAGVGEHRSAGERKYYPSNLLANIPLEQLAGAIIVRCVLVVTANRFARGLIVQETGWRFLQTRGIELIAVDSPEAFLSDTPTAGGEAEGAAARRQHAASRP